MDDRRRYRRIEADFSVELCYTDEAKRAPVTGRLSNCSTGGVAVSTDAYLVIGDRVCVRVVDPRLGRDTLELGMARVQQVYDHPGRGTSEHRLGLKFLEPDATVVQRLLHAAQVRRTVRARAQARRAPSTKRVWL